MTSDKKDKISGIKSTAGTKSIERAAAVAELEKVEKTKGVAAVRAAAGVGKTGKVNTLSFTQRQALFQMINEEAEKLFGKSNISKEHRKIAEEAVKMAIDSALVQEEEPE